MTTIRYNQVSIETLPNDKPIVYIIKTENRSYNYVGTAQRGRAQDRIKEHLGRIPGAFVSIEQFSSIDDARKKERYLIDYYKPKYNKQ